MYKSHLGHQCRSSILIIHWRCLWALVTTTYICFMPLMIQWKKIERWHISACLKKLLNAMVIFSAFYQCILPVLLEPFFGTIFQGVGGNCGYVYTSQLVKFCYIFNSAFFQRTMNMFVCNFTGPGWIFHIDIACSKCPFHKMYDSWPENMSQFFEIFIYIYIYLDIYIYTVYIYICDIRKNSDIVK